VFAQHKASLPDSEQKLSLASMWTTRMSVALAAVSANQLGLATAALEDLSAHVTEAGLSATRALGVAWHKAMTLRANGDYPGALAAMDEALVRSPLIAQKSRAPRLGLEGDRALALIGANRPAEAVSRLRPWYTPGMQSGSDFERLVVIGLALASALAEGEPQAALADFDAIAPMLAGEDASERAFTYFGSRAIVYRQRAAASSGALRDALWRESLNAGRRFSRALRAIRATGFHVIDGQAHGLILSRSDEWIVSTARPVGHPSFH
jgi:hypothetical protein